MSEVLLVENAFGIAKVTLNRPEARNALSAELVEALLEAFQSLRQDPTIRVIELTGAGDKLFCAGGDFSGGGLTGGGGALAAQRGLGRFAELLRAIRDVGKPVLGVMQGHAMGGGLGLAMACDLVVAADDVVFSTPEINVGLFPMIILPVLMRMIPRRKLMEMIYTGDRVTAREAYEWGFINACVPRDKLRETADGYIARLSSKSPAILKLGRDAFYRVADQGLDPALDYMITQLAVNVQTEDAMEGLSAFLQKRPPVWKGQ